MKWIKASERLPNENREYFVIDNGVKSVGIFSDGDFWNCDERLRVSKWLDESESPVPDKVDEAVEFAEWMDKKQMSRQIVRLKDNNVKWFYNHKPKEKEGNQHWVAYTTEQLYEIFKKSKQ